MKRILFLLGLFGILGVSAQMEHPKASPFSKIVQDVGLTTITVEYSRPAVRSREIFGELVPYGRIWRTGANESTKISFNQDVAVAGDSLQKGTYALYVFPEKQLWEVVFHLNTSHWGDGRNEYDPSEDVLRIKVPVRPNAEFRENFEIRFDSITHDEADLILHWANTSVAVPIRCDTKSTMERQIAQKLREAPTAQTYYEIARYYVEQNTNYKEALDYLNKAIASGGDTYYFYRVKSLAEAALEKYGSAITSAEKSLELAATEKKDEFVRMNQKNIELWKTMVKE